MMHEPYCLNCEKDLHEMHRYCPYCGQKSKVQALNFHDIGHDALHFVTHADKSIFSLVRQLAYKPGIIAAEYIRGKRQKYFKPLNFFLLVAGLLAFMTSLFYEPANTRSDQMEQAARAMTDPVAKQHLLSMAQRVKTVAVITKKYSNVINMLATPLFAFIFWAFYRKRFNYVESLVANMYFIAYTMLVFSLLIVPLQQLSGLSRWLLLIPFFAFEISYRGLAYKQLMGTSTAGGIAKAFSVSLLISVLWVALSYGLITLYIRGWS